ncbi:nucleotide-diphospho-sugar transferase [Breznakiellaceae bacterium SP9]
MYQIPILFIIFNRLDTVKKTFEVIREAVPTHLFIAADGPRQAVAGEKEKCSIIRQYILDNIDWNCNVKTLFRDENLGCGKAVSGAISWFFENVDEGVILEDDCLPSLSFFTYCKVLLEKYKDENQIYHIAGNNPLTFTKSPYSYYFARIQHCWGWATWKRAWKDYNYEINDLEDFINKKSIKKIFRQKFIQNYWIEIFNKMKNHEIDTWDYQWTYSIFKNDGICINPARNMITNIGFNAEATHTTSNDSIFNSQKRYELDIIKHPKYIKINASIISKINKIAFGLDSFREAKKKTVGFIKKIVKYICIKC